MIKKKVGYIFINQYGSIPMQYQTSIFGFQQREGALRALIDLREEASKKDNRRYRLEDVHEYRIVKVTIVYEA